jgi:hypothetical protein
LAPAREKESMVQLNLYVQKEPKSFTGVLFATYDIFHDDFNSFLWSYRIRYYTKINVYLQRIQIHHYLENSEYLGLFLGEEIVYK